MLHYTSAEKRQFTVDDATASSDIALSPSIVYISQITNCGYNVLDMY